MFLSISTNSIWDKKKSQCSPICLPASCLPHANSFATILCLEFLFFFFFGHKSLLLLPCFKFFIAFSWISGYSSNSLAGYRNVALWISPDSCFAFFPMPVPLLIPVPLPWTWQSPLSSVLFCTKCESPRCADSFPTILQALFGPSLRLSNIICDSTRYSEDLFTSDGWCRAQLLGDHLWPRNVGWLTTLMYIWIKECLSHVRITQTSKGTSM